MPVVPVTATQKANRINQYRQATADLLEDLHKLRRLNLDLDAMGYNPPSPTALVDADFNGENEHLTAAMFVAAQQAVDDLWTRLTVNANQRLATLNKLRR